MGRSRANARARSTSSSSFTPFITTAFTFTLRKPACAAAWMAAMVSSQPGRPVIRWKRSGRRVSSERFTASIPARSSAGMCSRKSSALEVIINRSRPWALRAPMRAIRSAIPRRTSGSPPVRRILRTPSRTKSAARRSISSKLRR